MAHAASSSSAYRPHQQYETHDTRSDEGEEFGAPQRENDTPHFADSGRRRELEPPYFNSRSNPLSEFLAGFLSVVGEYSIETGKQLYTQSSFIVLSGAVAGGVHYFASQQNPILSAAMDPSFHGSVALAKYVGLTFLIKAALKPLHKASFEQPQNPKRRMNARVVSYLTPMALAWIYSYYQDIPVKLATATLYTIGTIGVMKLLNKGYDYALTLYLARGSGDRF